MTDSIPVLWPDDISVKIVSPLAILRAQIEPLKRMTGGLLRAEVVQEQSDNPEVYFYRMELVAQALENFRVEILRVAHRRSQVYPATLLVGRRVERRPSELTANSEDEFIRVLGDHLRSPEIRSIIESLIAQINDREPTPLTAGEAALKVLAPRARAKGAPGDSTA